MKEDIEQNGQENDEFVDRQIIIADPKQSPIRIDKFLVDRLMRASRNRIQNGIKAGSVLVNDKEVKSNYKVRPGDVIQVILPRPYDESQHLLPQEIPLDIIYEDDDLLVLNKEVGMVVHPGIGHSKGTLVNALAYYFQELPVLGGNPANRLGLVHRIDKDTSGLLVVAKTDFALTHLAKQFYNHTIKRSYYALVWGEPEPLKGTIEANIGRHPRFRKNFTTFKEEDVGKWAVTHYEVIEPLYYVSLVKCELETGRTHQIRVHMKHLGHPLFNDVKYGGDQIHKGTVFSKYKSFVKKCFGLIPRQALHAKSLGFVHPVTGKEMFFDSELPEDFQAGLAEWRKYLHSRKKNS